jgi:hypothetical protein
MAVARRVNVVKIASQCQGPLRLNPLRRLAPTHAESRGLQHLHWQASPPEPHSDFFERSSRWKVDDCRGDGTDLPVVLSWSEVPGNTCRWTSWLFGDGGPGATSGVNAHLKEKLRWALAPPAIHFCASQSE